MIRDPNVSLERGLPFAAVLDAERAGDPARALKLAQACAADPRCVDSAASICGRILFGLGDVNAAIALMDRAPGRPNPGDGPRLFEYRSLFGRYREALEGVEAGASAETHARVGDLLRRRGDLDGAVIHLRRACELAPRSLRARLALAEALASMSATDEAAKILEEMTAAEGVGVVYLGAASRMALAAGAFSQAGAVAARVLSIDATAVAAHDVLAHLALFRGDTATAMEHAEATLAAGDRTTGLTLRGATRTLLGRDDEALADLDVVTRESDAPEEAHTWVAELLLRRGNLEGAMREADRAISEAQGFSLSARIIRLLAWHLAEPSASAHGAGAAYRDAEHREIADGLRQLSSTASRGSTEELSEALATLRGNRTLVASRMDAGQLVPVHVRPDSRWASRRLLSLVATCSEAELFAHFEHVIAEYPASGLPRCHRGEVNLWLGHYDAARSDLELVLEKFPHTRWAYIGLATLETIEGKHHRALDTLARGVARMGETSGPGIYGARGEALRKLGRAADAVAPLEQACILSPRRVSAWVNLALAYETLGRVADAQRVFAELVDRAYPLIHDAAGSVDARLDDPSSRVPVLEQALASALGNRSASVITWRVGTGPVRCLTDTTGARTITLARARELQGIRRVLAGRSP